MEFLTLKMPQVKELTDKVVVIPLGSVEEHGPHLPLGTDALTAISLCQEAAKRADALVAPPIYYGVCRSTKQHPGTVGVTPHSLREFVRSVIKGFLQQGFSHFVLFSGHAGSLHLAALKEVGEELIDSQLVTKMAVCSILDLVDKGLGLETPDDSHAGELETSLMLYLYPELVQGTAPQEYPNFPPFLLVKDKKRYWPGGVWGNPQVANKEKGKAFFEYLVTKLTQVIEMVKD